MIERCYSLSRAAKTLGIGRAALKRYLLELGLVLPPVRQGSHQMIPESVLERLMEKRGPRVNYALLRSPGKRQRIA